MPELKPLFSIDVFPNINNCTSCFWNTLIKLRRYYFWNSLQLWSDLLQTGCFLLFSTQNIWSWFVLWFSRLRFFIWFFYLWFLRLWFFLCRTELLCEDPLDGGSQLKGGVEQNYGRQHLKFHKLPTVLSGPKYQQTTWVITSPNIELRNTRASMLQWSVRA